MPTSAHFLFYQRQCQPLSIFNITRFRTMQNRIYELCCDTKSHTKPSANSSSFPMLPTAMPTTAHIRYSMMSDHVELNIRFSLKHQEPHQPQCQPLPIFDFTNGIANHCPYSILHVLGLCRIEYTNSVMTPRATPIPVPTSLHFQFYQLQCQPLPIFDIT